MAALVGIISYANILPPLLGSNSSTCNQKSEDILNNTWTKKVVNWHTFVGILKCICMWVKSQTNVFSVLHISQDKVFSVYFIILSIMFYYSSIILSNSFKVTEQHFLDCWNWCWKDSEKVQRSGHGLFQNTNPACLEVMKKTIKTSMRIAGLWTQNLTWDVQI